MNLKYEFTDLAVDFTVFDGSSRLPFNEWEQKKITTEKGQTIAFSIFERLLAEGEAISTSDTLTISNKSLARCALWELEALGLPPPVSLQLRISSNGSLTLGSNFTVSFGFYDGARYVPTKRKGILLEAKNLKYCLTEPTFALVEMLDAYLQQPITDPDERVRWWGKVTEILREPKIPDPKIVEGILGSYKVVQANFFTVNLLSTKGQLNISPRLLAKQSVEDYPINSEGNTCPDSLLPESTHALFRKDFKNQPIRSKYALSNNYFVALSPELKTVLGVVKQLENASLQEKIDFINNPYTILKTHLSEKLNDEIIDSLFIETPVFLSERVQGLCIWEARGVRPSSSSGEAWLPDDLPGHISFEVSGEYYSLTVSEFKEFVLQVIEALEDNLPSVVINARKILITPQLLDILRTASRLFMESQSSEIVPTTRLAPKIIDAPAIDSQIIERPCFECQIGLATGITLLEHQLEGLKWLQEHWRTRTDGALLADDMGLGKTIQTLAFMWWLRKQIEVGHAKKQPVLIVAPTALLSNWQEEAQKFFPDHSLGQVFVAFGKEFNISFRHSPTITQEDMMNADWALTTYETMRDKFQFFAGPFSLLVLDEAQRIKNPAALVTNNAKSIKAEMCLALTGTPVENSLHDLLSIVDRVQPRRLETLRPLAEEYDRIEKDDKKIPNTDTMQICDSKDGKISILKTIKNELESTGHPVILRRLKETHWKERPEKIELIPFADNMPSLQAMAYEAALAQAKEEMNAGSLGAMLKAIQRLRQISLHPPLNPADPPEKLLECSARIARLIQLLDEIKKKGEKVLIFVEYVETQARLQAILKERYLIKVNCINGSIPGDKRQEIVEIFQAHQDEFGILLLSPKAGGVGLTITAANHVIHLTRWWNPAVEDQCTDRAYRIGQSKAVTIYYPLAVHPKYQEQSFDWSLHRLLEKKRKLSRTLLAPVQSETGNSEITELWKSVSGGL